MFANAVAATEPGDGASVRVQPTAPERHIPRVPWRPLSLALAAGIVLAVATPWGLRRLRSRHNNDLPEFIALVTSRDSMLPPGWNGRLWSDARGANTPMSSTARGVRLGARLVDFTVASRAGDSSAAAIARDIATIVAPIPTASDAAAYYTARGFGKVDTTARNRDNDAATEVARLAGTDAVRLGAWLEAARLAAARNDDAFFREAGSRAGVNSPMLASDSVCKARSVVHHLLVPTNQSPVWPAMQSELRSLLTCSGSA